MEAGKAEFLKLLTDFTPGTVIKGTFAVKELVDSGGMAFILKGFHNSLKKDIAIKVLKRKWAERSGTLEYFINEGRKMALINHQYVVKVYDVGLFKDYHYLIMDYVYGKNLFAFIESQPELPLPAALDIMLKLAEGLSIIHSEAIIHRDIKPTNIIVNDRSDPILLDFGVAKIESAKEQKEAEEHLEGYMTGTPGFMAPELIAGHGKITKAVDIYSLGKTYFYMLSGMLPDSDVPTQEILKRNPADQKKYTENALRRIPGPLQKILRKMLEPNPTHRYQDADSVWKRPCQGQE